MKRTTLIISALLVLSATAWAFQPGHFDIVMQAGEDFWMDATKKYNGTPVDLTGNSYAAQFRSAPAPGGIVFATFSTIVTTPANGVIRVKLSRAQTVNLSGKSGVWDLRETNAAGQVTYQQSGKCAVAPTVTR
jgi:hypothetical protein